MLNRPSKEIIESLPIPEIIGWGIKKNFHLPSAMDGKLVWSPIMKTVHIYPERGFQK